MNDYIVFVFTPGRTTGKIYLYIPLLMSRQLARVE